MWTKELSAAAGLILAGWGIPHLPRVNVDQVMWTKELSDDDVRY